MLFRSRGKRGLPAGIPGHGIVADGDQRQSKENRGDLVPPHGVCRLAHANTADVCERDGDHHTEDVLNRPESQHRVSHCAAEILKRCPGDRTETEIQHEADQKLQVKCSHKQLTCTVVRGRPRAATSHARKRASERHETCSKYNHRNSEWTTSISGYMARSYVDGATFRIEN